MRWTLVPCIAAAMAQVPRRLAGCGLSAGARPPVVWGVIRFAGRGWPGKFADRLLAGVGDPPEEPADQLELVVGVVRADLFHRCGHTGVEAQDVTAAVAQGADQHPT